MGICQELMKTPVALLIFNRPGCTERVFEAIRQAKPSQLLVIADGPRSDCADDLEKCAAARAVIDKVDWDCEVIENFSDINLGCGIRPATGISWVFEHVEEAIILEDDCIPHLDFFRFCDELLERYRDDERIMHISGNNFWSRKYHHEQSYLFSRYPLSWGWATWRRAWQHYDFKMKLWSEMAPKNQYNLLNDLLGDEHAANGWTRILQDAIAQVDIAEDAWDYQWILTCWLQGGLAILPHVNLVSNVGFGSDSTHTFSPNTTSVDCPQMSISTAAMDFPLKHPYLKIRDSQVDRFIQDLNYDYFPKLPKRIRSKLNRILDRKLSF
jgi:hypothetical protein